MKTVPLVAGAANAHPKFTVQLGDNTLDFTVNYITTLESPAWSVDIAKEGVDIVCGAMLEPNADIVANYEAGIGKLIFVGEPVTLDNLGTANRLVWVADDE